MLGHFSLCQSQGVGFCPGSASCWVYPLGQSSFFFFLRARFSAYKMGIITFSKMLGLHYTGSEMSDL